MKTNFDFTNARWLGGAGERVSRHDLVFDAPMNDPVFCGIPTGNGDLGALFWCEKNRLMIVVNKCDLWDDDPLDDFSNWKTEEEEHSTTLRHGCRLILDFGEPVFDEFYLMNFRARLSLADGLVSIDAQSPFGTVSVRAFVNYDFTGEPGVLCLKVKAELPDDPSIRFSLERYGSRTFSHWYNFRVREYESGLTGTESAVCGDCMTVTHPLPCGIFACGAVVDEEYTPERENSHRLSGKLACGEEHTIYAGITAPAFETREDAAAAVRDLLDDAKRIGYDAMYRSGAEKWEAFWNRSYVETDDDFWDNLWALALYYANCSQRGSYPGRFIDGLWAHSRDHQAWNFYFHWNQQEIYWPLNAAGHPELCESYLNYRFRSLDKAKRTAEVFHHVTNGGAYVSDVCDRRGNNSLSELKNHTPAAEIALDFWRQYRYTQDLDFLREKALPWMIAAARYMQTLFRKEEDGLYHAISGTAYEGWIELRDVTTELGCTRALLRAVLEALETAGETVPEAELWQDMVLHIAPFLIEDEPLIKDGREGRYFTMTDGEIVLNAGPLKGDKLPDRSVVAAGYSPEHGRIVHRGEMDGIFPTAPTAPIFPCGDIGLKDRGTKVFDALANTVKMMAHPCLGWSPSAVYAARMGLGGEADRIVQDHISTWLWFHNGIGHYGVGCSYTQRFAGNMVSMRENDSWVEGKFPCEEWDFHHFGLECQSVIACARSETLMQSCDGVIRLFPAMKENATARFTLHAVGGFEVSAEMRDGVILWAAVRSPFGGKLTMEKPWDTVYVRKNGGIGWGEIGRGVIAPFDGEIDTEAGDVLIFTPDDGDLPETEPLPRIPNDGPKKHRNANVYIGRERSF